MIECLIHERVELQVTHVLLDLLIPVACVELREPVAKLRQIVERQLRNGNFDFVQTTHVMSLCRYAKGVNAMATPLMAAQRVERCLN